MRLGKVVKSNSHCDYIVQVDDETEFLDAPKADDYGFGTFVKLEESHGRHWAVGLVYNSQLLNPNFNNLGPRLTSEPDPVFAPDLITETRTLLWTVLIGNLNPTPTYGIQGIPRVVVPVDTPVVKMTRDEIHQFHLDPQGRSQFTYYSHLLQAGGTFAKQLTYQVLTELIDAKMFTGPEERALIVLSKDLAWRNTVAAMR
ncbi:MAG: hypothetical protein B0A82_06655 [Alkalinema sp. CACIAM 70d]|nr:MAG: hypothetical protein B0A82_06655 [Alkalinema sp. CACIAM 70d]